MLQSLLAERFNLKVHRENRDLAGYALVVAKGGPKLKPFGQTRNGPPIRLAFGANDTASLAASLSGRLQAPVVDKTNISGQYEFFLPLEDVTGDQAPSIFTLIEERWGLKLQSEKVPSKVLIIDQVERPTPN